MKRWNIVALSVLLAACGENPVEPAPIAARYDLRRLNGSAMPYDHGGLGCCTYLGGVFTFQAPRYSLAITAQNRNNGIIFTATEWGAYERLTNRIVFVRDSFEVAPFLLDTASIREDTLEVAFGGEGPGSPDQFDALFVAANAGQAGIR